MLASKRAGHALPLALALAFAVMLAAASVAVAAPSDQTMGLTALQAKLEASGTVNGYLKTVVKGSDIVTIPVAVTALTDGPLIMFNASGPYIDGYGGIAEGMSGSPIYVNDNGVDKVIGALSYGDSESLGGIGWATPIEEMLNVEQRYPLGIESLPHPVVTPAGVINRVMITNSEAPLPAAVSDGLAVAHPLSSVRFIGGVPTGSRMFQRDQALLAKHGITLLGTRSGRATPALGSLTFTAPFVPGAALAAQESRGDVYYGSIGTVTYTDSSTVLAYGHPESQRGASGIYMSNAWIDGLVGNQEAAYKMGRFGALRGTIVQDRGAAIMGQTDVFPVETTITAHATNALTHETTSTTTYMPSTELDTIPTGDFNDWYAAQELPLDAVYFAGAQLFDQSSVPGSAEITTTVKVLDTDSHTEYTVTMPNVISDSEDIPSAIVWDASDALSSFQDELSEGVDHFVIESIDLTSRISPVQRTAHIVGLSIPHALHTGANTVNISLLAFGVSATQTVSTTLTIPAGVPTNGILSATPAGDGVNVFPSLDSSGNAVSTYRSSVAEIVKQLNTNAPGNYIALRYVPTTLSGDFGGDGASVATGRSFAAATKITSITSTLPTAWAIDGGAIQYPTLLALGLEQRVMDYQGFDTLDGIELDGPDDPGTISLYGTPVGSATESLLGTTTVDPDDSTFSFDVYGFSVNENLRVHVDGSGGYLPTDTTFTVPVRCDLHFSSSATSVTTGKKVTLSAKLYPASNAGARVTFEYYAGGYWHPIATAKLAGGSSAHASATWKVAKGSHKVRARFLGSAYNSATTSAVKTIKGN